MTKLPIGNGQMTLTLGEMQGIIDHMLSEGVPAGVPVAVYTATGIMAILGGATYGPPGTTHREHDQLMVCFIGPELPYGVKPEYLYGRGDDGERILRVDDPEAP